MGLVIPTAKVCKSSVKSNLNKHDDVIMEL
jgi:hypothetical protein